MGVGSGGTKRGAGAVSLLATLTSLVLGGTGCILADGKILPVHQDEPGTDYPHTPGLVAAVGEVDITPPPGLPTYGYSTNGVKKAEGYWLRLKGRILALERQGTLVVLIQTDLGASSALVHRLLAERLAPFGITPGNLMLATTHTHGGPGGYFGDKFYNKSVGARPAYIPEYVEFLVSTLAEGTRKALDRMLPARLGVASASAGETATFNRSIEAWRTNYLDQGSPPDESASVDRRLYLLRVDIANGSCKVEYCPAGAWSVFAVHGTSMPQDYPLHHGDVHGLAARLAAGWIERDYGVKGFVAATATGAEGDVSPGALGEAQGKALAMRAATAEAGAMYNAFRSLDDDPHGPPVHMRDNRVIRFAYREESMRGAVTSRGRLCDDGALGAAEAAGSEASQGPLNGFLEMVEGATGLPRNCQSTKIKFLGDAQDLFYSASEYPDVLSFQVVTFGEPGLSNSLVLAAFPGEPTTEIGRAVRREIQLSWPSSKVAIVGLTNSYAMYFTTPSEYRAQHYEGGTTLYGPFQGIFAVEQFGIVAKWAAPPEHPIDHSTNTYLVDRTFQPGEAKAIWPEKKGCVVSDWKAGDLSTASEVLGGERITRVTFAWKGMKEDENCAYPDIAVECPANGEVDATTPAPFDEEPGFPATDEGYGFEVARDCDGETWRATWDMRGEPGTGCFIVVRHPALTTPLVSTAFSVGK